MKTFHRKNCQSLVRKQFKNQWGDIFIITGKHAFEWSVFVRRYGHSSYLHISFSERKSAEDYFKKLCKEYQ